MAARDTVTLVADTAQAVTVEGPSGSRGEVVMTSTDSADVFFTVNGSTATKGTSDERFVAGAAGAYCTFPIGSSGAETVSLISAGTPIVHVGVQD